MVGMSAIIKEIDCLTATVDDIRNVIANFTLSINMDRIRLSGFAGWFDVHFRVCKPCNIFFTIFIVYDFCKHMCNSIYAYVLLFQGSTQNPALHEVELTTAPSVEDSTHWGQQVCFSISFQLSNVLGGAGDGIRKPLSW